MLRADTHKTIIFVCNSPKDGFREGDGDLMDKLTTALNEVSPSILATRIVGAKPPAYIQKPAGHLVVVDELPDAKDAAGVKKQANVEFALDVPEEKLMDYVRRCRYALKLDIKGFAENASSIISTMIGMYLPTIASQGMVTPDSVAIYGKALCLLQGGLRLNNGEVVPSQVDLNLIWSIIQESDLDYRERIRAIRALREKKQFSIKSTADILMREIFTPLASLGLDLPRPINNAGFIAQLRAAFTFFVSRQRLLTAPDCHSSNNKPVEHQEDKQPLDRVRLKV